MANFRLGLLAVSCCFTACFGFANAARSADPNDWAASQSIAGAAPFPLPIEPQFRDCRLPGEFERQSLLVIPCRETLDCVPQLFVELVRHAERRVRVVAMISQFGEQEKAAQLLKTAGVSGEHVSYLNLPHDTMWTRDYGPLVIFCNGRSVLVDAFYDDGRLNDDRVPAELARQLQLPIVSLAMRVDGGNLLSNGQGLGVTTRALLDANAIGWDQPREVLRERLLQCYGFRELLILEPLFGETTGHIDMFATFVSSETVLVGRFDPKVDPENAAILDRNAERLARARGPRGPLRVLRIPMPPHHDGVWRTYSNVLYLNNAVLVPVYPEVDTAGRHRALQTFAAALPGWSVIPIDARDVIRSAGALHCVALNMPLN